VALLATAPAAAATRPRVAVFGLGAFDDSLRQLASVLDEMMLIELSGEAALDAIGQSEIARLLKFESTRQILGCDEDQAGCLAHVRTVLDVRFLIVGSLGRLGNQLRLDLKLIDVVTGRVVARAGTTEADAESMARAAPPQMRMLATAVVASSLPPPVPWTRRRIAGVALGGAAIIAVAAGALFGSQALSRRDAAMAVPQPDEAAFSSATADFRFSARAADVSWACAVITAAAGAWAYFGAPHESAGNQAQ